MVTNYEKSVTCKLLLVSLILNLLSRVEVGLMLAVRERKISSMFHSSSSKIIPNKKYFKKCNIKADINCV
jgi:hypothetical protein